MRKETNWAGTQGGNKFMSASIGIDMKYLFLILSTENLT